jgi:integrase
MYIAKRGSRYWFRKAIPLDLIPVLGFAEIRRSLRTASVRTARRRAMQMLVRVEDVYMVLRSEHPMAPARDIAVKLLEDALRDTVSAFQSDQKTPILDLMDRANMLDASISILRRHDAKPPRLAEGTIFDRAGIAGLTFVADPAGLANTLREDRPNSLANRLALDIVKIALKMAGGATRWDLISAIERTLRKSCEVGAEAAATADRDDLRILAKELIEIAREGQGTARAGDHDSTPSFDPEQFRETIAGDVRQAVASAHRDRWSAELLSKKIEEFLHWKLAQLSGEKHKADIPRRLANFLAAVSDKPVRDVTREDLVAYRDLLDKVPDRYEARLKTADMRKAVEVNSKRARPFKTIGPATVNLKYLGPVRQLFDWLVADRKVETNPADGIRSLQEDREAASTKKLPFKPDQITRIFASTSKMPRSSALYWFPLVLLLTGARPNEIAQMLTDDLRLDHNRRPHLSVLSLEDDEDEGDIEVSKEAPKDARTVKTAAGRRLIPIHPILIEAGFVDFIKARQEESGTGVPLFKDLQPNKYGNWAAAVTKRINRRIDRIGITNHRFSTYSFRHTFMDACDACGMPAETRMKIMGHQISGMAGIYGNPLPRPDESKWIEKVRFPAVDFKPYLKSLKRKSP